MDMTELKCWDDSPTRFPFQLFQVMFSGDFGDFDFDDGGAREGHGAVGDGLYAEGDLVAVVEHDGIKPGGAFL